MVLQVSVEVNYEQATPILQKLEDNKERWGQFKPSQRLKFLLQVRKNYVSKVNGVEWAEKSVKLQGQDMSKSKAKSFAGFENFFGTSSIKGQLDGLVKSYRAMVRAGDNYDSKIPNLKTSKAQDGRFIVHPPSNWIEKSMSGRVELYVEPGHDPREEPRHINEYAGKNCLCLGAGNQSFLSLSDVLHKLFVDGQTVVLKHHPLREFSAPYYDVMFAEMIQQGFFAHLCCDIETTKSLYLDDRVDTLHMTGGKPTHDFIVQTLREHGKEKPFTSELGSVTPWIVPSGGAKWSRKDMNRTLNTLLWGLVTQQSCNCLAPKVLVLDEDWPHHDEYIKLLKEKIAKAKLPPGYYPGLKTRYNKFVDAYKDAGKGVEVEQIESKWIEQIDPTITPESENAPQPTLYIHHTVDTDDEESKNLFALRNEPFAPVMVVLSIKGGQNNTKTFLEKAVPFVNDNLFGTLSCTMLVHSSLTNHKAVRKAIDDLRYGHICINSWTAMAFLFPNSVWGGYGETMDNVESGVDFVHNCMLVPHVQKSVLFFPFHNLFQLDMTSKHTYPSAKVLNRLADFMGSPGVFRALAILSGAVGI